MYRPKKNIKKKEFTKSKKEKSKIRNPQKL